MNFETLENKYEDDNQKELSELLKRSGYSLITFQYATIENKTKENDIMTFIEKDMAEIIKKTEEKDLVYCKVRVISEYGEHVPYSIRPPPITDYYKVKEQYRGEKSILDTLITEAKAVLFEHEADVDVYADQDSLTKIFKAYLTKVRPRPPKSGVIGRVRSLAQVPAKK